MVRHADPEMVVLKEEVDTHRSLEIESMPHHTGPHWETPRSGRRQKERGESVAQSL